MKAFLFLPLVFACACSPLKPSHSTSKQVNASAPRSEDESLWRPRLGQVPRIEEVMMTWDYADYSVLHDQIIYYSGSGQDYLIPNLNLQDIKSVHIDHHFIRVHDLIEEKALMWNQLLNTHPPDYRQRLEQLEQDFNQLFASVGIAEEGELGTKFQKLNLTAFARIEIAFTLGASERGKDLMQKYLQEFPFAYEPAKAVNLRMEPEDIVLEDGVIIPVLDRYTMTFDESSMSGVLLLEKVPGRGNMDNLDQVSFLEVRFPVDMEAADSPHLLKDHLLSVPVDCVMPVFEGGKLQDYTLCPE